MRNFFLILGLLVGVSQAQTTTTITGTIKDLSQALVTSGKVTFTLQPSRDTTISGLARFSPQQVVCLINASGLIKAQDGTSVCTLTMNTALNPPGTYYRVDVWPFNVKTSSFTFYAVLSTYDWSTVVPTPTTSPAQNFVDVFSNQTIGGNKNFTGNNIFTGSQSVPNLDGILFIDGVKYVNIAAAVTAAGSSQTVIVIPPAYSGADCPAAASSKLTFLDYRGGLNICTQNSISYGTTSGSGLYSLLRGINIAAGGVTVAGYFQNFLTNATGGVGTNADGGSLEADVTGTLTGTFVNVQAAENPVVVQSTGGTITSAVGQVGYVNSSLGSTTNITTVKGTWGLGCNAILGSGTIANCYGTYSDEQTHGATRNYALAGAGLNLLIYGANFGGTGWDAEDSSHVPHHFLIFDNSNNSILRAITANGMFLQDSTGATQQLITSAGTKFSTGIGNDGSGFKHIRSVSGCATTASAGATCDTTVTWTTAFADASYTVSCGGNGTTSGVPTGGGWNTKSAASVKFRTVAATAAAAQFTNVECEAVHD